MMITDYGYCNYVKKLQYSKYIVHQLKDIVTLCPQCTEYYTSYIDHINVRVHINYLRRIKIEFRNK